MHSFPGVVDPSILLGNDVVHHRLNKCIDLFICYSVKNYVLAHALHPFQLSIFIFWSTEVHPKVSFGIHDRTEICEGNN